MSASSVGRRRTAIAVVLSGLTVGAGAIAPASGARTTAARASAMPVCTPYHGSGIPVGSGIPPWGFHGPQSFSHGQSGYAHGWGNFSFATNSISGRICETVSGGGRGTGSIVFSVGPRMSYHSHTASLWGYPGNLIKTSIRVIGSTDPRCKVGTKGRVVMYASYNGVRSDSMQFRLGRGCRDQSRLYHGPQIDAQVPPL